MKAANLTVSTKSARFATEDAANKIAEGFRPALARRPTGKQSSAQEMLERATKRWPKTIARLAE